MKNFLYLCLSLHLTSHIYAETAESLVRNNLKQIINNALDALVSLEDGATDLSAGNELNTRSMETNRASESNEVSEEDLTDEIRELERLLLTGKNSEIEKNFDDSLERENKKREESSEEKVIVNRREKDDVKRSREEKATVVIDNDNLKNLVDLVVRTIDEEAKTESAKSKESEKVKKEIDLKREEKKDVDAGKKEDKKEVKTSEKKVVKKELCNTRKKECVEKKSDTIQKKSLNEKSVSIKVKKDTVAVDNKEKDDETKVRGMVEKILEGKNENVREALALLVEDVLEKSGSKEQKKDVEQ